MPSIERDTLNVLFRDRPAFAVEVLRDRLGLDLESGVPVHLAGNEFNDRPSRDSQADTVVIQGYRDEPRHGIIVEIQLAKDGQDSKRDQWARYAAALWLKLHSPVTVLVVCPEAGVASWAAQPIVTTLPGYILSPHVFGPEQIPMITDVVEAVAQPELAALSVMAHGEDRQVAEAFTTALGSLDPDHALQYAEYAYRLASQAARRILEEIMASTTWPVFSPFAKEHFGKGRAEGRTEGEAKALLTVLEAKGIEVTEEVRARISSCTDLDQLEEWLRRSVSATAVDDIFAA